MYKEKIKDVFYNKRFKDLIIYGFGQAINIISPLLVIPYIISVCGEEGLGKSGVGFSVALIAIVLVDYGSYINGTKEISIYRNDSTVLEEKFSIIYLSKFILLLLVMSFSTLLILTIPFFQKDKTQLLLSLFIVVGQFINPTWFFQGIQNFKWISAINVISKVIYVLLIFFCITKPEDYIYINFFLGIGSITASTLGVLFIYKTYSFSIKELPLRKSLELIRSEFTLTLSQLFLSFYQYAPIILVSFVCGNFIAGQYKIIDQIIMIFRTYFQMFFNFIYAEICYKVYENAKKGLKFWLKCNLLNYMMILSIVFIFYIFSPVILSYFKLNLQKNPEVLKIFYLGLLLPMLIGISLSLKQLVFVFNENNKYILITIISTIFTIILLYLALIKFALIGVFFTFFISEIIIIICYVFLLRKHTILLKK